MTQLTNLPDVSRFLEEVQVHDTVNLLIGEDTIQVNGIVISLVSKVLQDLAVKGPDLNLDDFVGDIDGVRDCVKFLYGGKVDVTVDNLKTITKFSIKFEVKCLYQVCVDWVEQNLGPHNLYMCIIVGLMVEGMRGGHRHGEILDACTRYIKNDVADDFVVVSEHWSLDDGALIRFLVQAELLSFTLPIFANKIQDEKQVKLLLDNISESFDSGEVLFQFKNEYFQLLELLSDKVGDLEMCKRINKLSWRIMNLEEDKNLVSLVSKNYVTMSVNDIIETEEGYGLTHFVYAEILMHWITHNQPSQTDFDKLWNTLRFQELYFRYIKRMYNALFMLPMQGGRLLRIPALEDRGEDYYHCNYRFGIEMMK